MTEHRENTGSIHRLPETELTVMKIIWKNGENVSSDTVVSSFCEYKKWERPAILTLLKRLEAKGFVKSRKEGKMNTYTPLVAEKDYLEFEGKNFLKNLYGNSVKRFVASLYDGKSISKEDLEELKRFIEEAE